MASNSNLKKMLGLKIVLVLFYLAATIFAISLVPSIIKNLNGDSGERFGAAIGLVVLLIYGTLAYVPSFITAILGSVISFIRLKRGKVEKRTYLFFIIALGVIVVSGIAIFLFVKLIA